MESKTYKKTGVPLGEARVGALEQTYPSPFMTIDVRNAVALKPSESLLIASSARSPRSQRDKHQNIRLSPISIDIDA